MSQAAHSSNPETYDAKKLQKVVLRSKYLFGTLRFEMIFLLLGALAWLSTPPARQSPAPKPLVRPCADSWNDSVPNKKKNRSKSSKNQPAKAAGACIELAFSSLDIQEHLQSYARAQQWKITRDQMTEDSWTFSLELDKEELLRDITEEAKSKRVEWTGGTVRVHVNTAQLPDGYARTIIRANFRGYGRNMDQFATHQQYWEMDSNNNFEDSIVTVLRAHFATAPPAGTPQAGISTGTFTASIGIVRQGTVSGFSLWTHCPALRPASLPAMLF